MRHGVAAAVAGRKKKGGRRTAQQKSRKIILASTLSGLHGVVTELAQGPATVSPDSAQTPAMKLASEASGFPGQEVCVEFSRADSSTGSVPSTARLMREWPVDQEPAGGDWSTRTPATAQARELGRIARAIVRPAPARGCQVKSQVWIYGSKDLKRVVGDSSPSDSR